MRLKELHIRNIASIERADIDFEHGLNDAVTGQPASIFLIAGDTGAGKSVILDSIAMALYRKTPRIAGVANPMKNEFTNDDGETIRVASIEQYTRLGISEKDECYSEVAFEGNDDRNYRARLTLGMYLGRRDKVTGLRTLKYNSPKWELKIDDGDWTRDSVEQSIREAVGLDFNQFGRLAMLAQGQFANFLTGDKAERQEILEQLTNTQHFSRYGEAISNIYKRAKDDMGIVQAQFDTERPHTLTDEEVDAINNAKGADERMKGELDAQLKVIETKLKLFADLLRAKQGQQVATAELRQQEATFAQLTADIADRQVQAKLLEQQAKHLKQWLEQCKHNENVLTKTGEVELAISQYNNKVKAIGRLASDISSERARTAELKKAEAEATAKAKEADEAVKQKQAAIDRLNQQRETLNLQTVIVELKKQHSRRQDLLALKTAIENLKAEAEENGRLLKDIQTEENVLNVLKGECSKVDASYQASKQEADRAASRLTTMRMGVDQAIRELRHRLYDGQAEHCPLCGQRIDHIHLDDEFKNMLTPLEEEQRQATARLNSAIAQRDKAFGKLQQLNGTHKSKLGQYDKTARKLTQVQAEIEGKAAAAGLAPEADLPGQIVQTVAQLSETIGRLEVTQREAEILQRDINRLLADKQPLDKLKLNVEKAKSQAANCVVANQQTISRLEQELAAAQAECSAMKQQLDTRLSNYDTNWLTDVAAFLNKLKADAQAYAEHQRLLAETGVKHEKAVELMQTLSRLCQAILDNCPTWIVRSEPKAFVCRDIALEWTGLSNRVSALTSKLKDCQQTIAVCSEALKADNPNLDMVGQQWQLEEEKAALTARRDEYLGKIASANSRLATHQANIRRLKAIEAKLEKTKQRFARWERLNGIFGGSRFRTLVQSYILRPLLNNANIYLQQITDRYWLTCSEDNEQLSILVLDRYNKNQVRSATVLSGGERFMISLALSLALSSLNRPDMNVNILFIDEGFGTLDERSLDSVMSTLEKLQEIAGQTDRRVGIISHREELDERIAVKIKVVKKGEGRSLIQMVNS